MEIGPAALRGDADAIVGVFGWLLQQRSTP
jgi:hypothetical protein